MASFVRYDLRDRVAVLTIDNPPVNALGQGVWEAIETEVERAAADPGRGAAGSTTSAASMRLVRKRIRESICRSRRLP